VLLLICLHTAIALQVKMEIVEALMEQPASEITSCTSAADEADGAGSSSTSWDLV